MQPHLNSGRLPFEHLNLRRNPFGEFTEEERTALAVVDVDAISRRLTNTGYAVQFVGDKGHGKTTHLLALKARLANAGYVHIPEGQCAPLPQGSPILIDESQRLTRWQRFRLFRRPVPLILGTHEDHSAELKRAGRTVETIEVGQGTSTERLHQILNARIEWVRRHDGPLPGVSVETVHRLRHTFGPDVRSILHELYVEFQRLTEVRHV
ncbi:MAG: hypothetical protein RIK87_06155 [Fuerstiella sp.]